MSNTIQTSCPAFSDGCPYANPHDANDATARAASTAKCPAFDEGCPFKEATTQQELAEMLKQVPDSHKAGGKIIGSISALRAIMASIHAQSSQTKERVGADCPVFQSSCPFKNLTSSGTPLVAELEYRTWSVFQLNAGPQDDDNNDNNDNDINILLSKNLKQGTKKSHRAAENVHFVKNFIKGKIDKEVYKQMVLSLWHVYTALEDELRKNATNPIFALSSGIGKTDRAGTRSPVLFWRASGRDETIGTLGMHQKLRCSHPKDWPTITGAVGGTCLHQVPWRSFRWSCLDAGRQESHAIAQNRRGDGVLCV